MKNLKNQNFEKMNKIAGDIITLHMCTKNLHHMRHSPEIQSETELSVILDHFWPFYSPLPPNNLENQNFEK